MEERAGALDGAMSLPLEVGLVWLLFLTVAAEMFVTYSRLPAGELYHVSHTGLAGGASRVLVFSNFSTALVALADGRHLVALGLRALSGCLADGNEHAGATLAIRLADTRAANGASFDDVAAVLAGTGTTTQNPASADPAWHASVVPTRSTVVDLAANERSAPSAEALGAPSESALVWRIDRAAKEGFDVALPRTPGRYVVSVLKVSDDGDVGAATLAIDVR